MKYCDKLKTQRARLNLTQKELAEELSKFRPGILQSRVAKWETGEGFPDGPSLVALASFTKTPIRYWCLDELDDPADPRAIENFAFEAVSPEMRLLLGVVEQLGIDVALRRLLNVEPA